MDAAVTELIATIARAKAYNEQPSKTIAFAQFHVTNLDEDIAFVANIVTHDPLLLDRAVEQRLIARRVRRELQEWILGQEAGPTVVKQKGMKMPQLELPVFSGDHTKFLVFWNALLENVVNNAEITDTAKWLILQKSLAGPAAELISEIPQTGAMIPVALKMLDDTYGGEERIITELYQKFHSLPPASNDIKSVRGTYGKLKGILLALSQLDHDVHDNKYLRSVYIGKFPNDIVQQVVKTKSTPFKDIRTNVEQLLLAREAALQQRVESTPAPAKIPAPAVAGTASTAPAPKKPLKLTVQASEADSRPKCVFCEVKHWSDQCQQYPTAEERIKKAADRCVKCIRIAQPGSECQWQRRCCYCDSLQHNRAFCPVKFPSTKQPEEKVCLVNEAPEPAWVPKKGCFLTCIAKVSSERVPKPYEVRILIDTAGGRSMITQEVARKLKLRPTSDFFHYTGIGSTTAAKAPAIDVPIQLHGMEGEKINMGAYIVDQLVKNVSVPDVERFLEQYPEYRQLYLPPTGASLPIDILIGGDNLVDIVLFDRGKIVDSEHQLMATKLGWLIATRQNQPKASSSAEPVALVTDDEHIKRMFDMELIGLADVEKTEFEAEKVAIDKFYDEIEYILERYDAGIPWIEENPRLGTNFGLALGRLRSLYNKLQRQPEVLQKYHQIILKQNEEEIIEKVFERFSPNLTHYMPHHPIICPEKNTKIRPVYDASAKSHPSEKSLNECILKGKKWLNDLVKTLMRFRRFEMVMVSDIAKAFHQIGIKKKDRDAFRFLWLKDPKEPPTTDNIQVYRFRRVAFGVISSPFLLHATITYHLNQQEQTPTVQIIRTDLYADNIVASLPKSIDAVRFYKETKKIFSSMSMNITKWSSNSPAVLKNIPLEDQNTEVIQNVLGLRWDTQKDTIGIKKPKEQRDTIKVTKRNVLRKAASLFDPLGYAVPISLLAKIFLRKLWNQEVKWDEELQHQLQAEWAHISSALEQAQKIVLPRQMFPEHENETAEYQFHCFVDASMQALAVAVYIVKKCGKQTYASFIAARSRLAPKKAASIPKLELMAVSVGVRFVDFVADAMQFEGTTPKYVWSDSRCVLSWLQSKRVLPTIVQKQVTDIQKRNIREFRYVPSEKNKADVATRGATYEELQKSEW